MKREYLKLDKLEGSLLTVPDAAGVGYGEYVDIKTDDGMMAGRVVGLSDEAATVLVFGRTEGIGSVTKGISFTGKPFTISLSPEILSRTFNGIGQPIDGGVEIYSNTVYPIYGRPINPTARKYPRNFIQTGISSIDCMMTLIRGQKLPIFSQSGLNHNELAAQIVSQASLGANSGEEFAVVFAAMGIKHDEGDFFKNAFKNAGVTDHLVSFLNYASDPIMERIMCPRTALSAAEYLAFELHKHVLVIMTDITSYGEALRELSSMREEVPSRKGYPGYLYSDLASIYERAGMIEGIEGSITLIPILTMPGGDISHPLPDLTGYITEGQIVLSKELIDKGIYPPINVLPSLSRLMKDGIGEGYTREDHPQVLAQLFSSYSKVQDIRSLASIIGEDDLSDSDRAIMKFGDEFEKKFLCQGNRENRNIEQTLEIAWDVMKYLPESEMAKMDPKIRAKYERREA